MGLVLAVLSGCFAHTGSALAKTYDIGPGQAYTRIGDVPWYALQPGDTVYIHHQPTPYYEKFLISGRGTPSKWIRVLGVPGPHGELPIVSGANATTGTNMHHHWQDATGGSAIQWAGVIQIAVQADSPGRPAPLPGYIEVANLQVQDGNATNQFIAENGMAASYGGFTACIYARSAKHILIRDNVLTNCGQGFYNWTGPGNAGGETYWEGTEVDTVLRGNYFYNNGNPGSYTEHQAYTESDGVVIEYNRFGPQRDGALGSQVKDRSAGTVIRYNFIEQSAGGWDIDLVEPQESWPAVGSKATYAQAFVYGNIIVNRTNPTPDIIHWNEDHQQHQGRAAVSDGKLLFYNNTLLTVANRSDMASFSVFNVTWGGFECPLSGVAGTIDVRNNIFATLPRTPGSAIPQMKFGYCGTENFSFGTNWVSPGWAVNGATVTGAGLLRSPADNNPGFVNDDVHLVAGSSAIGVGGALAAEVLDNALRVSLTPAFQYVFDQQVTKRPGSDIGGDLGAFAAGVAPEGRRQPRPVNVGSTTMREVPKDTVVKRIAKRLRSGVGRLVEERDGVVIGGLVILLGLGLGAVVLTLRRMVR